MAEFNTLLHRQISNGLAYSSLFPKASNTQIDLKKGDTFHSVLAMKKWVLLYYKQACRIAPILERGTLRETSTAIYSFLYHHLQYKQDNVTQLLRSPANSWANRTLGLDCKSYSIFASSILTCMGIKHYIRQIKQPLYRPSRFTHVYVIVPYNQQSVKLDAGYYVIDATVKHNKEPLFVTKDDVFMEKLPHVGLNGSVRRKSTSKRKKPLAKPKRKVVRTKKKKSGLAGAILLGLGAVVGLTQFNK